MTRSKRILVMLLVASVFLTGGPYGATLPAAIASVLGAASSTTPPCGQCCDDALPGCLPNAPCGLACPQLPALPSAVAEFWPAGPAHLVPSPVSGFGCWVPRPDPPPPRA